MIPMRQIRVLMIAGIALAGVAGCAHRPKEPVTPAAGKPIYEDAPSASLVFSAPVTQGEPPVMLAREPREPAVFLGYDELSITSYYIRTDDRQSDDYTDRHYRRAVIQKSGISYR